MNLLLYGARKNVELPELKAFLIHMEAPQG